MDFLSPLLIIIKDYLAAPFCQQISHALHVKKKLENLSDELSGLVDTARDVGRKVDVARARHQNPLTFVTTWQKNVESLRQEIDGYLAIELRSSRVLCQCLPNLPSRYKVGKRATKNLISVKNYKEEGNKFVTGSVVDPEQPSPAEFNAAALEEEVKHLSSLELDAKSMVENAKIVHGLQPYRHVEDWFLTVAKHKDEAMIICEKFQLIKEQADDLESNSWVSISVDLDRILKKIKDLREEGKCLVKDNNFVDPSRLVSVVQQSMKPAIGQEKAFAEVMKLIDDNDVKLIGIYGMGGVGKTTLFNKINNSLKGTWYDVVIFVVVSKDASIEGVQGDIMKRLRIVEGISKVDQRRNMIRSSLTDKKFVLMLDDIWTELDLEEVGIPIYGNDKNYKILLTTRYESVCDQMKANKVKIECLNDDEAWNLFERTVGKEILNSSTRIKNVGEQVAKECGGLPLALIVIGGAMRGKTNVPEWNNALYTLRQVEPELTGTLKLYERLKFSYTNLANDVVRECFCYCALFPEDWEIKIDSLVDCWIGEGFFEGETSIDNSRNKGYAIIADLKRACLLEDVEYPKDEFNFKYQRVKMHDVIRDMVLWIKKDEFVVFTSSTKSLKSDKWGKVKRLGITTNQGLERFLENCPEFLNLSTVLMEDTCVVALRDDFFLSMSGLEVLHLYGYYPCEPVSLPSSTCSLTRLRYFSSSANHSLSMKELGTLSSLEILKVRNPFGATKLPSFPLGATEWPLSPLDGVISRLAQLRVLHICYNDYDLKFEDVGVKVVDLKGLKHLEDLVLPISTLCYLRELAACPELSRCVSALRISKANMISCRSVDFGSMDRLEHITFDRCISLQEIVIEKETAAGSTFLQNLKSISLRECTNLQTIYCHKTLPQLEDICVDECWPALCVMFTSRDGTGPYVFPELRRIELWSAPVEYICSNAFSFPRLETLIIFDCPCLKNLPKGIIQARKEHLKTIVCKEECWDRLKWDSEEDRIALLPLLQIKSVGTSYESMWQGHMQ